MDGCFGTLVCTLLDRRSSAPLHGARALCIAREGAARLVDADARGTMRVELAEGVYDLVVSARGYLALTVRGIGVLSGRTQEITRGLIPGEGPSLDSDPATALAGVVRGRHGDPVPNVLIMIGAGPSSTAYTTRSDRSGNFLLHGVVPGAYDLVARVAERTLAVERVVVEGVRELVRVELRLLQV